MAESPPVSTLRFGLYEADLTAGELRRSGLKVKLQEKPFRILALLVRRPGEIVTREEVRQSLWPEGTFVDFDSSLGTAIGKLRLALGDSAAHPRFIETLPGRGYRFIYPVTTSTFPESASGIPAGTGLRRPWLWAGAALALLVLPGAGWFGWQHWGPQAKGAPGPSGRSLAVLPFSNVSDGSESNDPSLRYLSDGIAESVVDLLSGTPDLAVRPFDVSRRYRRDVGDPSGAGRKMGVDAVLTGNVRSTGKEVQIRLALIDVHANAQVWGDAWTAREPELPALARKAALAARDRILRLGHDARYQPQPYPPSQRLTDNADAYRAWMKGKTFSRNPARAPIEAGIRYLEEAVRLDPSFGRAWSSLAVARIAQSFFGDMPVTETLGAAQKAARKALDLDPANPTAWQALALTSEVLDWDYAAAERNFRKAIDLAPGLAAAKSWYSEFLLDMRRFNEALDWSRQAGDADPTWLEVDAARGNILAYAGRTGEAMAQYQRVLEQEPNYGLARLNLGRAWLATGRSEQAVEQLRRGDELLGHVPFSVADYGYGLARAGHRAEAEKMRADLVGKRKTGYYPAFAIAQIELGLGNIDSSLNWLERAADERRMGYYLPSGDPIWQPCRANPRFQKLLRRMNLGGVYSTQRAAPAASFSRLNRNRPDPEPTFHSG